MLSVSVSSLWKTYALDRCRLKAEMEESTMADKEWLKKYEEKKELLRCKINLESYFTEKQIGKADIDTLEIGTVTFPTGTILACDPLIELEDALPYMQNVPSGTYPVTICVLLSEDFGNRYACVKVAITDNKPVYYDLGVVGNEDLGEELEEGEYFGFIVDAGMGSILDVKTQAAFKTYWEQRCSKEEDIDPYNDLFCELLEENSEENPKYQREGGDWINWTVPETEFNIPVFASGWGDGIYPTYFGYDSEGKVCGIYILFIDIEKEKE